MIRRHATWMLIHPRSATFVSGLCFNFGEVFDVAYDTLLRTLLGAFRACPAPRRERRSRGDRPTVFGHAGRVTLPFFRGSALLPWVIRPARRAGPTIFGHAGRMTLPRFRAGGGYSVPLLAAQSRHEKPYPPISKINPTFPFILPFTGSAEKCTPFPRRFQAGNAVFENCARRLARRARPTRRLLLVLCAVRHLCEYVSRRCHYYAHAGGR